MQALKGRGGACSTAEAKFLILMLFFLSVFTSLFLSVFVFYLSFSTILHKVHINLSRKMVKIMDSKVPGKIECTMS